MNLDLSNKTALVCGGSRGIGKAAALELASLGADVVVMARNETALGKLIAELPCENGQKHSYIVADYASFDDVLEKIKNFIAKNPIHILINNTGGPPAGAITEASYEAFLSAFQNHLIANHRLTTLLLEGMKSEKYGRIINIISTSVKQPLDGLGVSNTTRAAVAGWAKTLSNEVAKFGITVNNVLPGATRTDRLEEIIAANANKKNMEIEAIEHEMLAEIPMKRFAEAKEVAAAIAFLASPAAAYITGVSLPVDGGRIKSLN
jgi:3-oxoacyl-[acyl-carrier protein] reductase